MNNYNNNYNNNNNNNNNNKILDYISIKKKLKNYNENEVDTFIEYLKYLETGTKRDKSKICKWYCFLTNEKVIYLFKKVKREKLVFDGKHVLIQNRGGKITLLYDYIAYKNKLLVSFPKMILDYDIVYKNDDFKFQKIDGKILYHHNLNSPFNHKDENIIGVYCIIKNKRGEFLVSLDKQELEIIRSKSKTGKYKNDKKKTIWEEWYKDMCIKSAIRKITKIHFSDVFVEMNKIDNENFDLSKPTRKIEGLEEITKKEIEETKTIKELEDYYHKNKNIVKNKQELINLLTIRKKEIKETEVKENKEEVKETEVKKEEVKNNLNNNNNNW